MADYTIYQNSCPSCHSSHSTYAIIKESIRIKDNEQQHLCYDVKYFCTECAHDYLIHREIDVSVRLFEIAKNEELKKFYKSIEKEN